MLFLFQTGFGKETTTNPSDCREETPDVGISPADWDETIIGGGPVTRVFTITNYGEHPFVYKAQSLFERSEDYVYNAYANGVLSNAIQGAGTIGASHKASNARLEAGGCPRFFAEPRYAADFENFIYGAVDGQNHWMTNSTQWAISDSNPVGDEQHLRFYSDGSGETMIMSPELSYPLSGCNVYAVMNLHFDELGTFDIIPQSEIAGSISTQIRFGDDGHIMIAQPDGYGNSVFDVLDASIPMGYFELIIQIDTDNGELKIYFDRHEVYSGRAFVNSMEGIVFRAGNTSAGQIVDIDNLIISNSLPESELLTFEPFKGILAAGESRNLEVTFDAQNTSRGIYNGGFEIFAGSYGVTVVDVPVSLLIRRPIETEIFAAPPSSFEMFSGEEEVFKLIVRNAAGRPGLVYNLRLEGEDISWLSLNKNTLNTDNFSYSDVARVTYNTSTLSAGTYRAEIVITADHTVPYEERVPIELIVNQHLYRVAAGNSREVYDYPISWTKDSDSQPSQYLKSPTRWLQNVPGVYDKPYQDVPRTIYERSRMVIGNDMEWEFPVTSAGHYSVELFFAEAAISGREIGSWIFDVSLEDQLVLDNYDAVADMGKGGVNSHKFNITVNDGNLNIIFREIQGNPMITAIEIIALGHESLPDSDPVFYQAHRVESQNIFEGIQHRIPINAIDINGDPISFFIVESLYLPFVSINNHGDGNAEIILGSGYEDAGIYNFTLMVSDGHFESDESLVNNIIPMQLEVKNTDAGTPVYRVNSGPTALAEDTPINWSRDIITDQSPYVNSDEIGFGAVVIYYPNFNNQSDAPFGIFKGSRMNTSQEYDMEWDFPVSPGTYTVNLYFIDDAQRIMDIEIEDEIALEDFHIENEAGHNVGWKKSFEVVVTDGNLDIDFIRKFRNPVIAGIEILFSSSSTSTAVPTVIELETGFQSLANVGDNVETYPNPIADELKLILPITVESNVQIQILDLQGKVYHQDIDQDSFRRERLSFDISQVDLKPGLYLLKVESAGQSWTSKLIKE